jgi:phage/plasmid-associated DNA primase
MGSPDPKLIPFNNCCLNWETGELIPHSPMLWNRYSLPFDYDPKAPSPKNILDFLKDRLEKDEVIALFRAFVWHVITGRSMKCFLEVSGPGNTGKSVLAALLQAAVGSVNIAATSLQRIEDTTNRFETYKLRGKRLLVCSESQGYSGQMEMLKAITGGDLITAERKNSVAPVDFYFLGGVLLVGNSPVRPSDRSTAVVNRRRSIQVTKVVDATDERQLLERDGAGGFQGELVPELGAFIKWVLEMDPTEARKAISRDITSFARANTEKEILLETDHLARWANERLIFDERASSSVGTSAGLLNDFTDWYQVNVGGKTYGQHNFKDKLVTLLRDVLCAPLPNGSLQKNPYRKREVGSVVPYVRLRDRHEDAGISGVVDWFFHKRVRVTTRNESVNGKRPVGDGRNEGNGISEPRSQCEEESRSEHPQQEPSKKSSGIYE